LSYNNKKASSAMERLFFIRFYSHLKRLIVIHLSLHWYGFIKTNVLVFQ
jgi:hypothetical protein